METNTTMTTFPTHYRNFLLYLKDHNLALAEYYMSKFPLPQQAQAIRRKKIQTQKQSKTLSKQQLVSSSSYDDFLKAVEVLAEVSIFGSGNIQPNPYRARKYIRMLRLAGKDVSADRLTHHLGGHEKQKTTFLQQFLKKK